MIRLPTLAGAVLALLACAPPPVDTALGGSDDAKPSIRLLYPETSTETVHCPTFTAVADVDDFVLVDEIGGAQVSGQGHWELYAARDGTEELLGVSSTPFLAIGSDQALASGSHVLYAELVTSDHQPLEPPARWRAAILVDDTEDCDAGDSGWGR